MWFYHHVWAVQVSYWQFLVGCVPSCASKARAMCEIAGCFRFVWHYMVVSWNRGTPKSSIEGCSIINQAFWIPPVVEIPISCPVIHRSCCLKNRIETTNHGLVISNMVMNQNLFYVYTYTCTVYIYIHHMLWAMKFHGFMKTQLFWSWGFHWGFWPISARVKSASLDCSIAVNWRTTTWWSRMATELDD